MKKRLVSLLAVLVATCTLGACSFLKKDSSSESSASTQSETSIPSSEQGLASSSVEVSSNGSIDSSVSSTESSISNSSSANSESSIASSSENSTESAIADSSSSYLDSSIADSSESWLDSSDNGSSQDSSIVNSSSDSASDSNSSSSSSQLEYLYTDFTAEEKAEMIEYIGEVLPFIANNEYDVECYYDEEYSENTVYFYTFGNTQEEFEEYLDTFVGYTFDGTAEDEDGDTWYFYSKGDLWVDVVYYYYEDTYVMEMYAYIAAENPDDGSSDSSSDKDSSFEEDSSFDSSVEEDSSSSEDSSFEDSSSSSEDSSFEDSSSSNEDSSDVEVEYLYTDFTAEEKAEMIEYIGEVLPFIANNEYYLECYYDETYNNNVVHFYTANNTQAEFEEYLDAFSSYTFNGTDVDDGDTWYLYSKGGLYIDVTYYYYSGAYVIDLYAYTYAENPDDGGDVEVTDGYPIEGVEYYLTNSDGSAYATAVSDNSKYLVAGSSASDLTVSFELVSAPNVYQMKLSNGMYVNSAASGNSLSFSTTATAEWVVDVDEKVIMLSGTSYALMYNDGTNPCRISRYNTESTGLDDYVWFALEGGDDDDNYVTLITNDGEGLPTSADGVYEVDFTKGEYAKDKRDLGYYLDGCPTTGALNVLVIPVEFKDVTAASKGYTVDKLERAFNGEAGDTDYFSVKEYFKLSSYGQLDLNFVVLDSWFRPEQNSSYYKNYTATLEGTTLEIGDQVIMDEALAYLSKSMNLADFDADGNGFIDAVVMINTLEIDFDVDFQWAYRYWNYYMDANDYYYEYDGVSANDYLWAPYQFMFEDEEGYENESVLNTYTFIHEFSHILGADDYYDTAYIEHPLGNYDLMSAMSADHNPYTKFNYGWLTNSRLVVAEDSITLNLEAFAESGDTIIIANNWSEALGVYQEYFIVMYYTNDGLNANGFGLFEDEGIVVYHVNASLCDWGFGDEPYYVIYNTNTDASDEEYGTIDNLIEFVPTVYDEYVYGVGDSLSATTEIDSGDTIAYMFTVDALTDDYATLTFTKNA